MERKFLFLAVLLSACMVANAQVPLDFTINREVAKDFYSLNQFANLDRAGSYNFTLSPNPGPNNVTTSASNPKMELNIDEMDFQEQNSKIIHSREIREKIRVNKLLKSQVYVSLGRERPFTQFELNDPLCCDNYEIFLLNNEKIFFNVNDKYLRVVNVNRVGDEIIYEVITHSGGKGKTSIELFCMFIFQRSDNGYKLVKKSFNEVVKLNINSL